MPLVLRNCAPDPEQPKLSTGAEIILREFDNADQAIRYAERMAQRCADSRSLMAMEYQDIAEELKAWKRSKHL